MKHEPFNESTEMYLKTIIELAEEENSPVPISALAERMGVSNVSATEMVHRLGKQGLLEHAPYKGVSLSTAADSAPRRSFAPIICGNVFWPVSSICRGSRYTILPAAWNMRPIRPSPKHLPSILADHSAARMAIPFQMKMAVSRCYGCAADPLEPGQRGTISRITPESTYCLSIWPRVT